ncbi:MAG: hypothetical protein WKH64_16235 [Chloroflexia bacterium]
MDAELGLTDGWERQRRCNRRLVRHLHGSRELIQVESDAGAH